MPSPNATKAATTIIGGYLFTITISWVLYHILHPNIINIYIEQGITAVILQYKFALLAWLVLACAWLWSWATPTAAPDPPCRSFMHFLSSHRSLIMAATLTLVFMHSYYSLISINADLARLYHTFKYGFRDMEENGARWQGWHYYWLDNYQQQTRDRLQARAGLMGAGQFEAVVGALRDIGDGIHAVRSRLINDRLGFGLAELGFRSGGVLVLCLLWLAPLLECSRYHFCTRLLHVLNFCLGWCTSLVFLALSLVLQSVALLNSHPVCLPQPNSSNLNIIITSHAVDILHEVQLSMVEDPAMTYNKICDNMEVFHRGYVVMEGAVVRQVLVPVWVAVLGAWVLAVGLGRWGRRGRGSEGVEYGQVGSEEQQAGGAAGDNQQ